LRYKRLYSESENIYLAFKLFLFFIRESKYKVLDRLYVATGGNGLPLLFIQGGDVLKILSAL